MRQDLITFNNHGLQKFLTIPHFPDASLAIGAAENLKPTGVRLYYAPPDIKKHTPYSVKHDAAKGMTDGQGETIDMSTFPQTGYMGQGLGGF